MLRSFRLSAGAPSDPRPAGRSRWRRWLRRTLLIGVVSGMLAAGTLVASALWIRHGAAGHIFTEHDVPAAPVALVLGAQVHPDGTPSAFLAARLDLARRLLVVGKVKVLLVSGDHMRWEYDEPDAMRQWLVDRGVPPEKIVLDYAGFDTYDSCARAYRIFGVRQVTVVTQTYHLPRAVALCRHLGLDANGVGDDTVQRFRQPWTNASIREVGAGVKALFDVFTGRDPVHLGRRETGVDDALRSS